MCFVIVVVGQCIVVCLYLVTMEEKMGLSSQGRKSSWFVSGMGVPGGMVVEPDREGYNCLGGIQV